MAFTSVVDWVSMGAEGGEEELDLWDDGACGSQVVTLMGEVATGCTD